MLLSLDGILFHRGQHPVGFFDSSLETNFTILVKKGTDLEVSVFTILKIDPATFETAHFDLESSKVAIGPQRYFSTYCLFRKNEKQNEI